MTLWATKVSTPIKHHTRPVHYWIGLFYSKNQWLNQVEPLNSNPHFLSEG